MKILMVAGEASGDRHGADLIHHLKTHFPELSVAGTGGDKMAAQGAKLLFHIRDTSVVGLVELLGSLFFFLRLYRRMLREVDSGKYSAVILIDYPTLNLRLAARANKKNLPVFYYVAPQVWAWHGSRIKKLARFVTKMLVILPFEKRIYQEAGLDCVYVGHPFIDIVRPGGPRSQFCRKLGIHPEKKIVGLLPGSRKNEIHALLPMILEAAELIKSHLPETQFVLPLAPAAPEDGVTPLVERSSVPITLVRGRAYDVMNAADALIIASGSATLEAALMGTPMVIVYRVNPLTYAVGKRLVKVSRIGLANIVAGREVAPELIQREANAGKMAERTLEYLKDEEKNRQTREDLKKLRKTLGRGGASKRAADEIARSMGVNP